jgi:hypothetical protein
MTDKSSDKVTWNRVESYNIVHFLFTRIYIYQATLIIFLTFSKKRNLMFRFIKVSITILFLFPYTVFSQNSSGSDNITEKMIQTAEIERYEAIIAADTSALGIFLTEEFIYHQPTGVIVSKQQYLENSAAGNPSILTAEFREKNITIYENFAISKGIVSLDVLMHGNETSVDLLFLNVWILRDGKLQLVARQSSFQQ